MMKQIVLCVAILVTHFKLFSQESKRNNFWTLGFTPVIMFDFNNGNLAMDSFNFPAINQASCIANENGELEIFASGFSVYNNTGHYIENGEYINCPKGNLLWNYYGGISPFAQTSIILPRKGNQYYIFSTGMSDSVATNYLNHVKTEFDILNYSIVDMDSNAGKGKVLLKNQVLAENRHYANTALTAVRHGNGKDWWLIKTDCQFNRYEEYIVRADTIEGPYYQTIVDTGDFCTFDSEVIFNSEGTKMACSMYGNIINTNFYNFNRVDLYNFDRCSGSINYVNHFDIPFDTTSYPNNDYKAGISFSPNGELLYMSNFYTIYQVDINDTDINNAIFISGPDTSISAFPWYSSMACAPNGKLYIGNLGGMRNSMSYIDNPNVRGTGCMFIPQGLKQNLNSNLQAPPSMPNYGLGWLPGCAPAASENHLDNSQGVKVYPNPATSSLFVKNAKGKRKELFNAVGQLLFSTTKDEMDISTLAKGIYYLRCNNPQGRQESKKVIIE